jgi:predicted RNA-binding Zn-ribbon protein involved in translation (DUF1610 family)
VNALLLTLAFAPPPAPPAQAPPVDVSIRSGSASRSTTPNTPPAGAGTDEGRTHPPGNAGAAGYWGWHPAYGTVFVRTPAPGVAARQPFRGAAGYHAGHACPNCGYQSPQGTGTWIVRAHNPDGTHAHACPACGTAWVHR